MRKFAIIGGTLWGNRGAEAMVVTTIGRVRERAAGASFILLSYYPAADRQLASKTNLIIDDGTPASLLVIYLPFAILDWLLRGFGMRLPDIFSPRRVCRLRECAALFDVSGISFRDDRLAVVPYNILCIWPALLLGVPVIRLSQAVGPFRRILNRLPAKGLLRACDHSFARGRITAEHIDRLGLPADRWSIAADVAFSFVPGDSITRESEAAVEGIVAQLAEIHSQGIPIVSLSPSSVVLKKAKSRGIDYVTLLERVILRLQVLGYHVLVLPNATRSGSDKPRNNDLFVIQQLEESIRSKPTEIESSRVTWVLFDLNTDSIRRLIGECDLMIASRFHAMVAALSLAVPTLVIGWSHKYLEVLEMFGCEAHAIEFSATKEEILNAIGQVHSERVSTRARILEALPRVVASSQRQFLCIDPS